MFHVHSRIVIIDMTFFIRKKCILCKFMQIMHQTIIIHYFYFYFLFFAVEVNVDDRPICVTLCDTAGQDVLDPLRQLCYPKSDVFLLCFSVVKPETFRSVATKWAPEISQFRASLILVGTQSDLRNDIQTLMKLKVAIFRLY